MKQDLPSSFHEKEIAAHYLNPLVTQKVANSILEFLPFNKHTPIVVICIGTDRSTGDSLGPLVGNFLQESFIKNFHVYGTLDDPIHAVNLIDKLSYINERHPDSFVIAVDACLGRMKNIGMIKVLHGPLKPGAGVKKELPPVGNIHITGIVNVSGYMEFFVLQNTRLNLVMKMAKQIAAGIRLADYYYSQELLQFPLEPNRNKSTFL